MPSGKEPIACSLSASDARAREVRWRTLAESALMDHRRTPEGICLSYRADQGVERELAELIELEGECCAFLDFDLTRGEGGLILEVRGPPDAAEIVNSFAPPAEWAVLVSNQ